jgi:hypothetical protein
VDYGDETEVLGASISLSLYFDSELDPVPGCLANTRGANKKVVSYGFTRHIDGDRNVSSEVRTFLDEHIADLEGDGINASWIRDRGGRIGAYLSLHPGDSVGGLRIEADVVAGLARLGAALDVDVI